MGRFAAPNHFSVQRFHFRPKPAPTRFDLCGTSESGAYRTAVGEALAMQMRVVLRAAMCAVVVGLVSLTATQRAHAQLFTPNAGVLVDGKGVLTTVTVPDPTGEQMRKRVEAARAGLPHNVAQKSPLRKISLNRLEAAMRKHMVDGRLP